MRLKTFKKMLKKYRVIAIDQRMVVAVAVDEKCDDAAACVGL